MKTAKERIELGAKWLDMTKPDWKDKIDLSILDMDDSKHCIIGQVFGNFNTVRGKVLSESTVEKYGFIYHDHEDDDDTDNEINELTEAWKEYLNPSISLRDAKSGEYIVAYTELHYVHLCDSIIVLDAKFNDNFKYFVHKNLLCRLPNGFQIKLKKKI